MIIESAEVYEIVAELERRDAIDYRLCGLRGHFLDSRPHFPQQHLDVFRERVNISINVGVFLHRSDCISLAYLEKVSI